MVGHRRKPRALSGLTGMPSSVRQHVRSTALAFMRAFEIPGLAIAIVRPDGDALLETFGVRALGEEAPVDIHTQFAIASNSKAFLAACIAMEVDRGALGWDDPVVKHLPDFRMSDPAITAMMTVRDLLVHRSGLPLGAGDLMLVRQGDFTAEQVMAALPHFVPEAGFRAGYAYDNCLYIVAGLLLERVTGVAWNDYVPERIFGPLGMTGAAPNPSLATGGNRAGRHARLGPPVIGMGPIERITPHESDVNGPAGGIHASIANIVPWLQAQLNKGRLLDGERLWSEAQADQMWKPQTIIASGPGPTVEAPQRAVLESYALGWGVNDYRGQRMLTHAGQLAGQTSRIALLPDAGFGLAVFINASASDALSALRYALLDLLLAADPFDWLAAANNTINGLHAQVQAMVGDGEMPVPEGVFSLSITQYAGRYRDPWYGDIDVTHVDGALHIRFVPTAAFASPLEPFGDDAFRTRFPRGTGEDAVVHFAVADARVTGVTMQALSPLADFSFDYQHLAFVPVTA
ncbi:MAG: serine hydrolase [Sphingomonadales bacterium]|nr:MAG: serine hydrolase [Sphingomonadales bacterium]